MDRVGKYNLKPGDINSERKEKKTTCSPSHADPGLSITRACLFEQLCGYSVTFTEEIETVISGDKEGYDTGKRTQVVRI